MSHNPAQSIPSRQTRQAAWARLTRDYLLDLDRQLDDLRTALRRDDYTHIKQQAHRAKGTSGTFRLADLSRLFAQLETAAASQQRPELEAILTQLAQCIHREQDRMGPPAQPPSNPQKGHGHD